MTKKEYAELKELFIPWLERIDARLDTLERRLDHGSEPADEGKRRRATPRKADGVEERARATKRAVDRVSELVERYRREERERLARRAGAAAPAPGRAQSAEPGQPVFGDCFRDMKQPERRKKKPFPPSRH
ncbi:MAG: hypothetical protein WD942_10740 [Dehalococcoidia bacterium]